MRVCISSAAKAPYGAQKDGAPAYVAGRVRNLPRHRRGFGPSLLGAIIPQTKISSPSPSESPFPRLIRFFSRPSVPIREIRGQSSSLQVSTSPLCGKWPLGGYAADVAGSCPPKPLDGHSPDAQAAGGDGGWRRRVIPHLFLSLLHPWSRAKSSRQ